MDGVRITQKYVDRLKPSGKDEFHWDNLLPGFGVRVQRSGASSYVVKYRAGVGRQITPKRVTLGSTTKLAPDDARTLAKRMIRQVANGADPAKERRKAKAAIATTLKAVAEVYLTSECGLRRDENSKAIFEPERSAIRSGDERIRVFEQRVYISSLAGKQIGEVKNSEITPLLEKAKSEQGPEAAKKLRAFLSALFS